METLTHTYIASLGHSGSTILAIALGSSPGGVSVGEVDATVRRFDKAQHRCTCGAEAPQCPVWGPVFTGGDVPASDSTPAARYAAGYRALYRSLRAGLQPRMLVDPSKDPEALRNIPAEPGVNLKVIFLVKDPRSYFVSHYRKWLTARRGKQRDKRRAPTFLAELAVAIVNWWWGNRRFLRMLRSGGYDYVVVNYEELVLDTARVEVRLSEFLHTEVALQEIPNRPEQRHILRGNALRHNPDRSSRLRYDYRWFYDPWVRRLGFAFAPLLKWGMRNGLLPVSAPPAASTATTRRLPR